MNSALTSIPIHQMVRIESISGAASAVLEQLGFVPGTMTRVISKAPFLGPIAVEIRGSKVALRHEDAKAVLVSCFH